MKERKLTLLFILLLTFLVYSFSLTRNWQFFDEALIFEESLFPIPSSFREVCEIITNFVLNAHIESLNTFFTSNISIRYAPIPWIILSFLMYLFKNQVFLYQLFQVLIHLINTCLVWLIFNKTADIIFPTSATLTERFKLSVATFACIIFSLHSANTEAVLLLTNWNVILGITICLFIVLKEINELAQKTKIFQLQRLLLSILAVVLIEQTYSISLVLFLIISAILYKRLQSLQASFSYSLKVASIYLTGTFIYFAFLIIIGKGPLFLSGGLGALSPASHLTIFIERIFWLAPQVFLHALKLLFFPVTLSLYQSNLVPISHTLTHPYAILSIILFLLSVGIPVICFFKFRKNASSYLFLLFLALIFSFLPFLHILYPVYNLFSDRYCYFPSFLLSFLILNFFLSFHKINFLRSASIIVMAFIITLSLTSRTLVRVLEWRNCVTLLEASIKPSQDLLNLGYKYKSIATYHKLAGNTDLAKSNFDESLKQLNNALVYYKNITETATVKEPLILKQYGIDYKSKILQAAYLASDIRFNFLKQDAKEVLDFYSEYIEPNLSSLNPLELVLYIKLLINSGEKDKSRIVLIQGLRRFPLSSKLLEVAGTYYLTVENDLELAKEYIEKLYKYFPNRKPSLMLLANFYNRSKNLEKLAHMLYLLGLRTHVLDYYKRSADTYLSLNLLDKANKTINKLIKINDKDPSSLLLKSKYLLLSGRSQESLDVLKKAYEINNKLSENKNLETTKSILISLSNVSLFLGDLKEAQTYLNEYEKLESLNNQDINEIKRLKEIIAWKTKNQ